MSDAFIGRTYNDGDKDWDAPKWRTLMDKELIDGVPVNFEKERTSNYFISEQEIGFKHPQTGATIKLRDDGAIELFVNEDTGMRFDPKENAIIFYGDSIHMVSKDTHIHTRPHGFAWNQNTFNPALYYEDESHPLPSFQSTEGKNYKVFGGKARKSLYDEKIEGLMRNLGTEVVRR